MDHFSIAMLNFSRVHAIPLGFFGEEKDIWDGHIFWCWKMTGVPHLGFALRHLSYTATQSLLLHCMLQSYMKKLRNWSGQEGAEIIADWLEGFHSYLRAWRLPGLLGHQTARPQLLRCVCSTIVGNGGWKPSKRTLGCKILLRAPWLEPATCALAISYDLLRLINSDFFEVYDGHAVSPDVGDWRHSERGTMGSAVQKSIGLLPRAASPLFP